VARKRSRDYRAEYKRRLERALKAGYSRKIARGHAGKREYGIAEAKEASKKSRHVVKPGHSKIHHTGRTIDPEQFEKGLRELEAIGIDERAIRELDIHDEDSFIAMLLDAGYTPREAYRLRFS